MAVLPDASVTSYVLVVVPIGKVEPEASPAISAVVAPGQLSVPTGSVYVTGLPQNPAVFVTVVSFGQDIAGNSVSVTIILKEQEVEFPTASVETYV